MLDEDFSVTDSRVTVRSLLGTPGLDLRAVADTRLPQASWDRPVSWVHGSDLPDPSPFLEAGVVLLTTGTQFAADGEQPERVFEDYVARLMDAEVAALGFGTEVVRDGVPAPLTAACSAAGLPLFEVPFQTPFIAVTRAHAAAVSARDDAQRTWVLNAQRAMTRAALGPSPVPATVRALATALRGWVGLLDASGEVTASFSPPTTARLSADDLEAVAAQARSLLRRASRAAGSVVSSDRTFALQTVGGSGRLTGVIAVASPVSSPEAQSVMASALALLGLATGQADRLMDARLALRSGLIELLIRGETDLATSVSEAADEPIPPQPVTVMVGGDEAQATQLTEWLAARPARTRSGALAGRRASHCIALVSPAAAPQAAREIASHLGGRWGLSTAVSTDALARACVEAETARTAGTEGSEVLTRYDDVAGKDVLTLLHSDAATTAARHALAPLLEHDAQHEGTLVATLTAWLEHDCLHEETARALGVHRHTVRTRIRQAERLLGHSLQGFRHRAQLWTALRLTSPEVGLSE